jgi:hypothetical protein
MTESNSLHGPRKDDALKRETRGEVQANRATRSEEWREPEPPGEDQPDATWAPVGKQGSAPPAVDQDALETRSDLARHLERGIFPVGRAGLIGTLEAHHAPQALIDLTATLPGDVTFANLHDVLTALGLTVQTHPF